MISSNYIFQTASVMGYALILANLFSLALFKVPFHPIVYAVLVVIFLFINSKMTDSFNKDKER